MRKWGLFVIIVLIMLVMAGCTNSKATKYSSLKTEYYKTYVEITSSIVMEDTYKALENLQTKKNTEDIKKLRNILQDMNTCIPESKKDEYAVMTDSFTNLGYLQGAYKKWTQRTSEEDNNIFRELLLVNINKEDFKSKLKQ